MILEVVDAKEIILFGFYATANYIEDSDIDLMILVRKEKLENLFQTMFLFFENSLEVDVILKSLRNS